MSKDLIREELASSALSVSKKWDVRAKSSEEAGPPASSHLLKRSLIPFFLSVLTGPCPKSISHSQPLPTIFSAILSLAHFQLEAFMRLCPKSKSISSQWSFSGQLSWNCREIGAHFFSRSNPFPRLLDMIGFYSREIGINIFAERTNICKRMGMRKLVWSRVPIRSAKHLLRSKALNPKTFYHDMTRRGGGKHL